MKPDSILLDAEGNVKLGDSGFATRAEDDRKSPHASMVIPEEEPRFEPCPTDRGCICPMRLLQHVGRGNAPATHT
ncbi:hypothetical protein U0070_022844 [Myodes glareolus]|uniref:Protein kinase domain-containing protein n=1 Tax=Myodes glareolus TaxID=447135 RepID=A0AAW0K6M0_MYOGA